MPDDTLSLDPEVWAGDINEAALVATDGTLQLTDDEALAAAS